MTNSPNRFKNREAELLERMKFHREGLKTTVDEVGKQVKTITQKSRNAGLILLGTYVLLKILSPKKKKKQQDVSLPAKKKPVMGKVAKAIMNQIALFLLAIAKQRLMTALSNRESLPKPSIEQHDDTEG